MILFPEIVHLEAWSWEAGNIWSLKPPAQQGRRASLHTGNAGRKEALAQGQGFVEVDTLLCWLHLLFWHEFPSTLFLSQLVTNRIVFSTSRAAQCTGALAQAIHPLVSVTVSVFPVCPAICSYTFSSREVLIAHYWEDLFRNLTITAASKIYLESQWGRKWDLKVYGKY